MISEIRGSVEPLFIFIKFIHYVYVHFEYRNFEYRCLLNCNISIKFLKIFISHKPLTLLELWRSMLDNQDNIIYLLSILIIIKQSIAVFHNSNRSVSSIYNVHYQKFPNKYKPTISVA